MPWRPVAISLATAFGVGLLPTGAHAETLQEIVAPFHLLGEWSANCGAPLSEAQHTVYLASSDGGITRRLVTEKFTKDMPVVFAGRIDADRLDLRFRDEEHTIQLVVLFENERHRTLESRNEAGAVGVKGGVLQATGKETRWFERCGN